MALWVTAAEVKAVLAKLEVDISDWDDAEIGKKIKTQQAVFQNDLGRSIESTARTDRVNGSGIASLVAPDFPIITLTQVAIISEPAETYTAADLYVENSTGVIWIESSRYALTEPEWPKGKRNIEIQATYGYAAIPDEIQEALTLATAAAILIMEKSRLDGDNELSGLRSFKIGNYSEAYGKDGPHGIMITRWDALVSRVADQYRNRRVV